MNLLKVTPLYKTLPNSLGQQTLTKTKPTLIQQYNVWFKLNHHNNDNVLSYTRSCVFVTKVLQQHRLIKSNFKLNISYVNYNHVSLKKKKNTQHPYTPLLDTNQKQLAVFNLLIEKKELSIDAYLLQFTYLWQQTSYHFLMLSITKSILSTLNVLTKPWSKTTSLTQTGGTPLLLTIKWL